MGDDHNVLISLLGINMLGGRTKSAFSAAIQEILGGAFEEVILPFDGEDEGFPRIILKSRADQNFAVEVFPSRINLKMGYRLFTQYLANDSFHDIVHSLGIHANRLGLVRGANLDLLDANQLILDKYVKEEWLTESKQIKLHFLRFVEVLSRPTNVWTKIESNYLEPSKYIIEFDVNSSTEDLSIFTGEQVKDFISQANTLITQSYEQYRLGE